MAIVFEEVSGEIAPERERPEAESAEPPAPGDEPTTETLRRALHVLGERERRLRAD